jgi:hypothetical protein
MRVPALAVILLMVAFPANGDAPGARPPETDAGTIRVYDTTGRAQKARESDPFAPGRSRPLFTDRRPDEPTVRESDGAWVVMPDHALPSSDGAPAARSARGRLVFIPAPELSEALRQGGRLYEPPAVETDEPGIAEDIQVDDPFPEVESLDAAPRLLRPRAPRTVIPGSSQREVIRAPVERIPSRRLTATESHRERIPSGGTVVVRRASGPVERALPLQADPVTVP